MEESIKDAIIFFIGKYGWLFLTGFLMFFFKSAIESLFYGIKFMFGNEYNVDDIIYINNKKCRIVRQGLYRTTFYIIDEPKKFHIPNHRLQYFIIEKEIQK